MFIGKTSHLPLLLPLLLLIVMALLNNESVVKPVVYSGSTVPGEGFVSSRPHLSWSIRVKFDDDVIKQLKARKVKPRVFASINGDGSHSLASGTSAIYAYNHRNKDWFSGFTLHIHPKSHLRNMRSLKGKNKINNISFTDLKALKDHPKRYKWYISYMLVIPQE